MSDRIFSSPETLLARSYKATVLPPLLLLPPAALGLPEKMPADLPPPLLPALPVPCPLGSQLPLSRITLAFLLSELAPPPLSGPVGGSSLLRGQDLAVVLPVPASPRDPGASMLSISSSGFGLFSAEGLCSAIWPCAEASAAGPGPACAAAAAAAALVLLKLAPPAFCIIASTGGDIICALSSPLPVVGGDTTLPAAAAADPPTPTAGVGGAVDADEVGALALLPG